ncbi:MAG: UDP-N-acetylglucosamine--N-acetylmuramyl-(pentapeptide) pyrophosphoryl-undecaprenol N-acetylglucosamine transferase [Minisyncoccia bacterium]
MKNNNIKRIVLTGGGTGGHIYPLLAVADEITKNYSNYEIYYIGPLTSFEFEFERRNIKTFHVFSSKWRRYFSLQNFTDIPKFFISIFQALIILFKLMPDVIFSKGGPGSFPVILAAKFYFIPIMIHESDSVPSIVNKLSSIFAQKIGISFQAAKEYFPQKKIVFVGHPIRAELLAIHMDSKEAKILLGFDDKMPLIFVTGGSQGAEKINNFIINNLESFLSNFQIMHQVGPNNVNAINEEVSKILPHLNEELQRRYKMVGFLNVTGLRDALTAADIVISRSGAGSIYEIAAFGKPSILVPITNSANNHQLLNAYEYSDQGAAVVVEEENLKFNIVKVQIQNIINDSNKIFVMSQAAKKFAKPESAQLIVKEIIALIK